tara:strand:+ start:177 stop:569 length:393 start_codon:yes stop_codon:yes gene_type:complete
MKYEDFLGILMPYKKLEEDFTELYSMGFDFLEGKFKLEENASRMLDAALNSNFDEKGVEWIHWFMYENDWGTKDWSKIKTFDSQGEVIDKDLMKAYGATDKDGNPICHSFESTWEVVKEHLKKYGKYENI